MVTVVTRFNTLSFAYTKEIIGSGTIRVWGSYYDDIERIDRALNEGDIAKLDLDGEYVIIYESHSGTRVVILRGHIDSFSLYYFLNGNFLYLSDDYFWMVGHFKEVTWNRVALADYFEVGWNNIQKNDNTPFLEIKKLPALYFIDYRDDQEGRIKIEKYHRPLDVKQRYDIRNLEAFTEVYIKTIRYYLSKVVDSNAAFTVSGGIDSSTLASLSSLWYPDLKLSFYSSRFKGENDESGLTIKLNSVLSSEVKFLDVECPSDFIGKLKNIIKIVQCPYSDIEGVTHHEFFQKLRAAGASKVITGFGADLTFGGTPYEYPWLVRRLVNSGRLIKGYYVFVAHKDGIGASLSNARQYVSTYIREYLIQGRVRRIARALKRLLKRGDSSLSNLRIARRSFLRVDLPTPQSASITNYDEALRYAWGDSALRQLSALQRACGLQPFHPFEGKEFAFLAKCCDPYIFAKGVNKYCLRKSVKSFLPAEIIANKKKFGNGGYEKEIFEMNLPSIKRYLQQARQRTYSTIVDVDGVDAELAQGKVSDEVFRALNILLYEEILNEMGIVLNV